MVKSGLTRPIGFPRRKNLNSFIDRHLNVSQCWTAEGPPPMKDVLPNNKEIELTLGVSDRAVVFLSGSLQKEWLSHVLLPASRFLGVGGGNTAIHLMFFFDTISILKSSISV